MGGSLKGCTHRLGNDALPQCCPSALTFKRRFHAVFFMKGNLMEGSSTVVGSSSPVAGDPIHVDDRAMPVLARLRELMGQRDDPPLLGDDIVYMNARILKQIVVVGHIFSLR